MARLPSLPQALLQILEMAERDDVGITEMAAVIGQDVGLAAKIISTANSAYYSRGRQVVSIDQCLSVMGAAQVRRIALNQSVAELFGRFQKSGAFDLRYYWHHVLCVALVSRELSKKLDYANADEAYLAGLLHDVGQLALLMVVSDQYATLFNAAKSDAAKLADERQQFGMTHAEVGAWLAHRWNLHSFFADALLYHHEPLTRVRDAHALVQIVSLANRICTQQATDPALAETDLAFWSLSLKDADALYEAAEAEAKELADALGIEIEARTLDIPFAPLQDETGHARLAEAVSIRMEATATLPENFSAQTTGNMQNEGAEQDTAHAAHHGPHHETTQADAYQALLRSAKMLFSTRNVSLFVAQNDVLQGQHVGDDDARLGEIRIHLPASHSAIAEAYAGKIGLSGQSVATDSLADAQVLRILGSERLLCIPLRKDEQNAPLGVLVVGLQAAEAEQFLQRKALLTTFSREGGRRLADALQQIGHISAVRTQAEEAFQLHTRKMVHEANNPLGVVRNYIALLRQQLGEKHQAQEDINLVESELRRVARILQQMKNTDGPSIQSSGAHVDINALINEVIRFCRMGRPELASVQTRLNLETPLPSARVDGDKVKQVLTNLIFNAAEAMPGGGEISISTTTLTAQLAAHTKPAAAAAPAAQTHQSIEITVSDTGPGLPANVLNQLYQPVQSQKGGAHQGLGLSIISQLVRDMGGLMQCKSTSSGTHFKILLPANG